MRRIATNRQPGISSPAYLPLTVKYATRSPIWRRGAKLPARHNAEMEGKGDSKSGSRRHDPSMKGGKQ